MINVTRTKLRKVFDNRPAVDKGFVMKQLGLKKYDSVRAYFVDLEPIPGTSGRKFITEDVIDNMLELREFID